MISQTFDILVDLDTVKDDGSFHRGITSWFYRSLRTLRRIEAETAKTQE